MSAAEGAKEASSPEQANVRTDERVAQYFHLGFWLFWPTVEGGEAEKGRGVNPSLFLSGFRSSKKTCKQKDDDSMVKAFSQTTPLLPVILSQTMPLLPVAFLQSMPLSPVAFSQTMSLLPLAFPQTMPLLPVALSNNTTFASSFFTHID